MSDERGNARQRLREAGAGLLAGVIDQLPSYLTGRATRVLDAWGRLDRATRADVDLDLAAAIDAATRRVVADLTVLVATDPAGQRATPLELVRSATREPTAVLAAAGIPEVVRDDVEARLLPDDRYGLAPRTFVDLGGDTLGPLHLAWGLAKASALREPAGGPDAGPSGSE